MPCPREWSEERRGKRSRALVLSKSPFSAPPNSASRTIVQDRTGHVHWVSEIDRVNRPFGCNGMGS